MKNDLYSISTWLSGNNQSIDIIVNGRPIKVYGAEGKSFIEARHGAQYSIKLRNHHSHRVLAIVSVDGLDVLSGSPAADDSGGYIIPAFGTYEVKGFRVSDDEVNKFEFADKDKSYAKLGEDGEKSTANCGVIAVRFIHEKVRETFTKRYETARPHPMIPHDPRDPYPYEVWDRHLTQSLSMDESPVRAMSMLSSSDLGLSKGIIRTQGGSVGEFDMGTKFSEEKVTDRVTTTTFERGEEASSHTIYYASRSQLEAFEVEFEPKAKVTFPEPFKPSGYCKPPKKR